jgi:iron(III) transport system ATP-binding protein
MVGLGRMGRRYPHQLSGGQQQRVALARALAVQPRIVLLDEPFSSLDATLRASVRADVHEVLRRAGTTTILVTHDQDEALSLADHVAVIREGRIGQAGTPEALYIRPTDPELARFFGEINLVEGRRHGEVVETALGALPVERSPRSGAHSAPTDGATIDGVATDGPVVVMVRPEQIELSAAPAEGALGGVVMSFEYYGHDAVLRVRPDLALLERELVVRVTGGGVWEVGARVGVVARGPVLTWPADSVAAPGSSGVPGVPGGPGVPGAPGPANLGSTRT